MSASTFQGQFQFPDTTQSSSSSTGAITTAGGIGVAKTVCSGEGFLPPTGGTVWSSYSQGSTASITWSGAMSGNSTWTFTKNGNIVFCKIPVFTGSPGSGIVNGSGVPSQFRPSSTTIIPVQVMDSSSLQTAPGMLTIFTDGTITLWKNLAQAGFSGSGTGGLTGAFTGMWMASSQ